MIDKFFSICTHSHVTQNISGNPAFYQATSSPTGDTLHSRLDFTTTEIKRRKKYCWRGRTGKEGRG